MDRDGVINEKPPEGEYVESWQAFHLLNGVPEAIARLNRAGLLVLVVSNQRGIALGRHSEEGVDTIHANLQETLEARGAHLDGIYCCPHNKDQCDCRKPAPGLFYQAVAAHPQLRGETSVMIGDSLSDIEFGKRLRMLSIFIQGDPTRRKAGSEAATNLADAVCRSLAEAVNLLLDRNANQDRSSA